MEATCWDEGRNDEERDDENRDKMINVEECTHEFPGHDDWSQCIGEEYPAVRWLQSAVSEAYLEFAKLERITLEENAFLRSKLERLEQDEQLILAKDSLKHKRNVDPHKFGSETQTERLYLKLENILEESAANQRALQFAKNFIEIEALEAQSMENAFRQELAVLEKRNKALKEAINDTFGPDAAKYFVQPEKNLVM